MPPILLADIFDDIWDAIKGVLNFFDNFVDWLLHVFNTVLTWFAYLAREVMKDLLNLIKYFGLWIIQKLVDLGTAIFNGLAGTPHQQQPDVSGIMQYVRAVNEWVPLDLSATLVWSLLAFWVSLATFRFVKSLIPSLGR